MERLEFKAQAVSQMLAVNKGDWRLTYYHWFSQAFGLKVNTQPMLMLARQLSPQLVMRLNPQSHQAEALFLGMAGFLETAEDEYTKLLLQEFNHLKNKHQLRPLPPEIWKYSRLRPPAFPQFRLALLATFWKNGNLALDFEQLLTDKKSWVSLFEVEANAYWKSHYRLGKESKRLHQAKLGQTTVDLLLINVLVPFLYAHGKATGQSNVAERAMEILTKVRPEKNKITRIFESLGFENNNASNSQALIALHNYYCKPKACLKCSLGIKILKHNP